MNDTALNELRKFVAPELIFGPDSRLLVARYARKLGGRRVLLVSDPGVADAGWTREAEDLLAAAGLGVTRFLGVSPNPRDSEVVAGAALFRESGSDLIVAVGGGSPMDCAKGIGILAANGGAVTDYQGVDQVPAPMPPLICVPTTGGSSADVSQFAIINHVAERVKVAIISKAVVPDVALIDPRTLLTLGAYLSACTGMDALTHGVEAYGSNAHSPLTDLHALEAVRLVREHLEASCREPGNLDRRDRIMLGSLHAGLAFSNASLGCVHALAHSLGGFLDLPHGECNALLLPAVLDFNFPAAPERYRRIAQALGCDLAGLADRPARDRLSGHARELARACGIEPGLGRRGVADADLPRLAAKALADPCNATNPRPPSQADLLALLAESM